jgi:16S rRNA G966 N2-methylase RsmD
LKTDVFQFLEKRLDKYDVIFADPPYELDIEQFLKVIEKVFENNFKIIVGANLIKIQPAVPQGVYIIKVEFGDKIQVKKIIKY